MKKFMSFKEFALYRESMVAGDSGGDPVKIASGETSGSVVTGGASITKKKKGRKYEKPD